MSLESKLRRSIENANLAEFNSLLENSKKSPKNKIDFNSQDFFGYSFIQYLIIAKKRAPAKNKAIYNTMLDALLPLVNLNFQDTDGQTALHIAIGDEDLEITEKLISAGAQVNIPEKKNKGTAIHWAASNIKNSRYLQLVLKNSKHEKDLCMQANGLTPIHLTVINDDVTLLQVFIDHGVNFALDEFNDLLHMSIVTEKKKCAQMLIGANIPICLDKSGKTPLIYALEKKFNDIAGLLFPRDFIFIDENKNTPLHRAIKFNLPQLFNTIMMANQKSNKYNFNEKNAQLQTPLHYAANADSAFLITLLKLNNLEINAQDKNGYTALAFSVRRNDIKSVSALLAAHAQAIPPTNMQSLMHLAAIFGCDKVIPELIKNGIQIDEKDKNGVTPLHLAIDFKRQGAIDTILKHASITAINIADNAGNTPFHLAAKSGNEEVIKYLISQKIILIENNEGNTPLHLALINKHKSIAKMLLEQDNSFDYLLISNKQGQTAYDLIDKNDKELMNLYNSVIAKNEKTNVEKQSNDSIINLGATDLIERKKRKKKKTKEVTKDEKIEKIESEPIISLSSLNLGPTLFSPHNESDFIFKDIKAKWWQVLQKYTPKQQKPWQPGQMDYEPIEIPFDEWKIKDDFEFHERMDQLNEVFNLVLKNRKYEEFGINDGVYIVGSSAFNALISKIMDLESNDTDIQLVGADLSLVKLELEKNKDIKCKFIFSANGNLSLRVTFSNKDSVEKKLDIISISNKEFKHKLYKRDITMSGIILDYTKKQIIAPAAWLHDLIHKIIRCIDIPQKSFIEDFTRKLRVIRFYEKMRQKKLDFTIDKDTYDAIIDQNLSFAASLKEHKEKLLIKVNDIIKDKHQHIKNLFNKIEFDEELKKLIEEHQRKELQSYEKDTSVNLERSMIISLRNQLEKIISLAGCIRTMDLLVEFNMSSQIILTKQQSDFILAEIKLPSNPIPEFEKYQYNTILNPLLASLKTFTGNLSDWLNKHQTEIIDLVKSITPEENLYNKMSIRFIGCLLMMGANLKPLLNKQTTLDSKRQFPPI